MPPTTLCRAALAAIALTACGGGDSTGPSGTRAFKGFQFVFYPEVVFVGAGDTLRVNVQLQDTTGRPRTEYPVTFVSSDPSLLSVDSVVHGTIPAGPLQGSPGDVALIHSRGAGVAKVTLTVLATAPASPRDTIRLTVPVTILPAPTRTSRTSLPLEQNAAQIVRSGTSLLVMGHVENMGENWGMRGELPDPTFGVVFRGGGTTLVPNTAGTAIYSAALRYDLASGQVVTQPQSLDGAVKDQAVSADDQRLFVVTDKNRLYALDATTLETLGPSWLLPFDALGGAPYAMIRHPWQPLLYVSGDDDVKEIDMATGQVERTLQTGGRTRNLAIAPDGRWLYVGNAGHVSGEPASLQVWDLTTNSLVKDLPIWGTPTAVRINPQGTRVYVGSEPPGRLYELDTGTLEFTRMYLQSMENPGDAAFLPDGTSLAVIMRAWGGVYRGYVDVIR
ncbi:MAG TPA: PQQ-binding-like beta-propeller repeat protein [Gemmatimonadales bacterium]|nr:PQQ-binding-like beta-propeller repeat protein [Gemmatimonadales bacterium]